MSFELWLSGLASAVALFTGFLATRASRHASDRIAEIEAQKVDSSEADRQHKVTQDLISNLRLEIDRLRARVLELSKALETEQAESLNLRKMLRELTEQANNLRHQVRVLQQRLQQQEGL